MTNYYVAQMMISVFDMVENMVGIGEKLVSSISSSSHSIFERFLPHGCQNIGLFGKELTPYHMTKF